MTASALSEHDLAEIPAGYRVDPWFGTTAWCSLPWPDDPGEKAHLIANSLGPQIIDWAEWRTFDESKGKAAPGLLHHLTGVRWKFTDGQKRFLILWYAYDPATGRWLYRSGVKRGAKGTGKDPFGAALCLIELLGPSRLVRKNGRWTGEQRRMALVQIASNSEAQSKDVLRVANGMLGNPARKYFGLDCGLTRTLARKSGGLLEILTASEKSSEGDPASFILLNESHHMTHSSGGHLVAAVARRNVGKSPFDVQARVVEMTNAHSPGNDSVAEQSYNAWQAQVAGLTKLADILYDSIEAPPDTDIYDDGSRMAGLRAAYADAPWSDLVRLSGEMLDIRTTIADSIRYYLNGLAMAEDAWIDPRAFDALARADIVVDDGERITMFLDCSKSSDATALVASRVSDGHVFTLGVWSRPHGDRGKGWLAPREEVDATARAAVERYSVMWFGIDPSPATDDETEALYWRDMIDGLHRDLREQLPLWATPGAQGNSVLFDMRLSQLGGEQRNRQFTEAAMATRRDINGDDDQPGTGTLTHDGDPRLRLHTHQAHRRTNKWGTSLGKASRDSKKHVDAAVCMVGARMGRRIVLNSGVLTAPPKGKQAGRVVAWG